MRSWLSDVRCKPFSTTSSSSLLRLCLRSNFLRCAGVAPSLARYAFNASSIAWHRRK